MVFEKLDVIFLAPRNKVFPTPTPSFQDFFSTFDFFAVYDMSRCRYGFFVLFLAFILNVF